MARFYYKEIIRDTAQRSGLSEDKVRIVLAALAAVMYNYIGLHNNISLPGVGKFIVKHKPLRRTINPRTLVFGMSPPKNFIRFLPAGEFTDAAQKNMPK